MDYQDTPIFQKFWDPADTAILNKTTGEFSITNHFFETGEELIYRAGSSVAGLTSTSIGIGVTADSVGIVTNKLPYQVYAIRTHPGRIYFLPGWGYDPDERLFNGSITFNNSGGYFKDRDSNF